MARAAEDLAQGRLGLGGKPAKGDRHLPSRRPSGWRSNAAADGGQGGHDERRRPRLRPEGTKKISSPGRKRATANPTAIRARAHKMDIQKAREILEELQRRAAEAGRPTNELDYLDRLAQAVLTHRRWRQGSTTKASKSTKLNEGCLRRSQLQNRLALRAEEHLVRLEMYSSLRGELEDASLRRVGRK